MNRHLILLAACAALTACTDMIRLQVAGEPSVPAQPATISVYIPEEGLSKVSLSQDSDPDGFVKLAWEDTDVITVKDAADESRSAVFHYSSGAGRTKADFDSDDISALSGASSYNVYLTSNLPGGFNNQTQDSDGSTGHLGYCAMLGGVDRYDSAVFSQAWAGAHGGTFESSSVLRIRAQMPTAAIADAVRKVIIKASSNIFDDDNELAVSITTPGVEGDGKVVTAYATLPPGDVDIASGTELLFQFQVSEDVNDKYTAYRRTAAVQTLRSGEVNAFKINCPHIEEYAGTGDDGMSEGTAYLIGDRHQMQAMHDLLGDGETRYFRLVDDVDLSGINWIPLSIESSSGSRLFLDGGGHTVSNLTVGSSNNYPSFAGYLRGEVRDVMFDGASITCGSTKEQSAGVLAAYITESSGQEGCSGITIRNSTLNSAGAYVGVLAARVGKAGHFSDCNVVNCSVTSTSGSCTSGFIAYIDSGCNCSISDCSAERVTVSGTGHYAGGLVAQIASSGVSISRCHTTGSVSATGKGRHVGGLVGAVDGQNASIGQCYSTCDVRGYGFCGGLIGSIGSVTDKNPSVSVVHCFASGNVTNTNGINGLGGLVGQVGVPDASISRCIAWNGLISPYQYTLDKYSSGAVVGRTHPNCVLTDNYRNPGMNITAYWVPGAAYDHPDVNGTAAPLVRIGTDGVEANAAPTSLTAFDSDHGRWAYHGKHLPSGTIVEPDDVLGWTGNNPDIDDEPETGDDTSWSDVPTISLPGATTVTIRAGVEWTHFHGTWEGAVREINIVRTTLDEHNSVGIYYNYQDEALMNLDRKCEYLDALVGTNGPMACCQFVRVDDVVKRKANEQDDWIENCAFTLNGRNEVDIVKVASNFDASRLPDRSVGCAGPLLVYNGEIQEYPDEWNDEDFLKTSHPRTAFGLSKDRKTVIQVTVDGRYTTSNAARRAIGMPIPVLAELMRGLGCYKALNFDGGGGTAMWIYGQGDKGIVNHPCENRDWDNPQASLRAAGNAIYIKSDLK